MTLTEIETLTDAWKFKYLYMKPRRAIAWAVEAVAAIASIDH